MDDLVKCVAYRVVAYGDRTAKLCVRADVADEWASNCRNEGAPSVEVQPLCEIAAATKELERLTAERDALQAKLDALPKMYAELRDEVPDHKSYEGYAEGWVDACNECAWAQERK